MHVSASPDDLIGDLGLVDSIELFSVLVETEKYIRTRVPYLP
jgi:hypothetical protein